MKGSRSTTSKGLHNKRSTDERAEQWKGQIMEKGRMRRREPRNNVVATCMLIIPSNLLPLCSLPRLPTTLPLTNLQRAECATFLVPSSRRTSYAVNSSIPQFHCQLPHTRTRQLASQSDTPSLPHALQRGECGGPECTSANQHISAMLR